MKIGIDNYSYHRYFGEIYPGQKPPPEYWGLSKFVDHILTMIDNSVVEGLSIETCFLPDDEKLIISELSRLNIPFIFQWGHPNGFMDTSLEQATNQLKNYLDLSQRFGNQIMRIVASSINYYDQPHDFQIQKAIQYLDKLIKIAENHGIFLALENHGDFFLSEIKMIIDKFDTPYLGVVVDTGNFIRMNEDPQHVISMFGDKTYLVHAKDVAVMHGYEVNDPRRYGCVPAGKGKVDFQSVFDTLIDQSYEGMVLVEISRIHPEFENLGEIGLISESLNYLDLLRKERLLK